MELVWYAMKNSFKLQSLLTPYSAAPDKLLCVRRFR